jgi:ABC-type uncharacterized transport system permease subunit
MPQRGHAQPPTTPCPCPAFRYETRPRRTHRTCPAAALRHRTLPNDPGTAIGRTRDSFIFLWTIFRKIPLINGWKFWDVVLIYSLVAIAEGLSRPALVKIGLNLVTSCSAFWLRTTYSMFPFSMHTLGELTRFPLTIYSTAVRLVLSIVLPFAFMSFFPATSVLGHGAPVWVGLLTPAVAAYCLFMGVWIFRLGLRRYESAGH